MDREGVRLRNSKVNQPLRSTAKPFLSFRGRPRGSRAEPGIQLFEVVVPGPRNLGGYYGPVRQPIVYILASNPSGTLHVGVTSDLIKRVWQHRNDAVPGFTKRYRIHPLVHFEQYRSMIEAIEREKELKKRRRAWKVALIEGGNPNWRDLWPEICG